MYEYWADVSHKADTSHLEDSLVLGLDALQETRLREGKLCGGSLQVVVGLCFRHPLHKLRQVTLHTYSRTSVLTLHSSVYVVTGQHHYYIQEDKAAGMCQPTSKANFSHDHIDSENKACSNEQKRPQINSLAMQGTVQK